MGKSASASTLMKPTRSSLRKQNSELDYRCRTPLLDTNRSTSELSDSILFKNLDPNVPLQLSEEQKAAQAEHFKRHAVRAIVSKLKNEAISRFGNIRGMFRALDTDGGGDVDFSEFTSALSRVGLDNVVNPEEQRIVFDKLDSDNSGEISYMELAQLFDPQLLANKAHKTTTNQIEDKYHPDRMTPRTYLHLEALKERIVQKIMLKAKSSKVAYKNNARMMLNTFHQLDADGDSALTYQDLERALGPEMLDLGFHQEDVRKLMLASDRNRDGFISFKEFINFLCIHDIDPSYNPFHDGRKRQVQSLQTITQSPLKWQHLYDKRNEDLHNMRHESESAQEMEENDTWNILTPKNVKRPLHNSFVKPLSQQLQETTASAIATGPGALETTPTSIYDPVHTGAQLLEKLKAKNAAEIRPNGRFTASLANSPHFQRTDFSRTGFGGDGTSSVSGMYMSSSDRFRTTSNSFFGGQHGVDDEEHKNPDKSMSVLEAEHLHKRIDQKAKALHAHLRRIKEHAQYEEDVKAMEEEARLRGRCKTRLQYFDSVWEKDHRNTRKLNAATLCMQRGGINSHAAHVQWRGNNTTIPMGINIAEARHEKKYLKPNVKVLCDKKGSEVITTQNPNYKPT